MTCRQARRPENGRCMEFLLNSNPGRRIFSNPPQSLPLEIAAHIRLVTGSCLSPGSTGTDRRRSQPFYEEMTNVIDCKNSTSAIAERTVYNRAKDAISHFKWADPEALDMTNAVPIAPGSILAAGERIVCDERIRTPLLRKGEAIPGKGMAYIARTTIEPFADVYYAAATGTSSSDFGTEVIMLFKYDVAHSFAETMGQYTIVGLPRVDFITRADVVQLNCTERKVRVVKMEYYDSENDLLSMVPAAPLQTQDAQPGSIFRALIDSVCGAGTPNVGP